MKVLVVCNNAYMRGNGVCTAVVSLVKRLREKGIEMGKRYAESIHKYNAEDSTRQIIQMYKDSIAR